MDGQVNPQHPWPAMEWPNFHHRRYCWNVTLITNQARVMIQDRAANIS
jgi:hypothetical protein